MAESEAATLSSEVRTNNMTIDCEVWRNNTQPAGANVVIPVITSATGIIGNVIAILVLQKTTRKEQARTVFYVLVASLAWTDLLGILFTTWPVLLSYFNNSLEDDDGLCKYHAFAMISFALITPCIVCTMAIERYVGIRHGYFYKSHISRPRARVSLLVEWLVVLLVAALPLFHFGSYSLQYPCTWCFLDMHPSSVKDKVYGYIIAVVNLIMILVIVVCNVIVTATLLRMRHKRKHENSPANDGHRFRSRRQREIEMQMVILLVGITCVFTLCWAPLMIQILINQSGNDNGNYARDLLAVRLASINQILDPWVYILFRKSFFSKCWICMRNIFNCGRVNVNSVYTVPPNLTKPVIFATCPPRLVMNNHQRPISSLKLREDSGTESGAGELSTSADSIFLRPEANDKVFGALEGGKSHSWCCQYNPDPSKLRRNKLRTQSTQTQCDSFDADAEYPILESSNYDRIELRVSSDRIEFIT